MLQFQNEEGYFVLSYEIWHDINKSYQIWMLGKFRLEMQSMKKGKSQFIRL
uniref:Uncharacterized protein n=1 Tax=Rhizophora mucronata TaxID=61149 RepID=A0A2P2J284_RHIMU